MTWVDFAILGVLGISALLAFMRGLVREILGIAAWAGAIAAGVEGLPQASSIVRQWSFVPTWLVDVVAFAIVFVVTFIVLSLIARAIGRSVRGSALGGVDRSLGLVFGLLRGAALVIVAYILAGMASPVDRWPAPVLEARALEPVYNGAKWVVQQVPVDYRPRLYAPPAGRQATADALMQATPQGRATDRPPVRE